LDDLRSDPTRHVARRVTAHAIRDQEEADVLPDAIDVFVRRTAQSTVGDPGRDPVHSSRLGTEKLPGKARHEDCPRTRRAMIGGKHRVFVPLAVAAATGWQENPE